MNQKDSKNIGDTRIGNELGDTHSTQSYPVFPLHTVLFSGCMLPLRIFEQRYLRMVKEVSMDDAPFVIALIDSRNQDRPSEVGQQSVCYQIACLARISDFNQREQGVLDILVRAGTRVVLGEHYFEEDKLMRAKLEHYSEPEPELESELDLKSRYHNLLSIYKELKQQDVQMVQTKVTELSATELSFYLAHVAPISNVRKQSLLEMNNTEQRLDALEHIFKKLRTTFVA